MSSYKHTQIGQVIIISMAVCMMIAGQALLMSRAPEGAWLVVGTLAVLAVLFSSLTITIDDGLLRWRFGPGPIRKSVRVSEIQSVEPVKNSWTHGWGIHWTCDGWVYNVSGWDAVQVKLKNGKQFRLGTDEPRKLAEAIEEAMRLS